MEAFFFVILKKLCHFLLFLFFCVTFERFLIGF
ncbi:hypothetical protein HPGAM_06435 [Helicobacter pylori Gambia94/24]|nr:hypothetical protein HPGAM_06435 [Helicobacter pylori Gambia94/24]